MKNILHLSNILHRCSIILNFFTIKMPGLSSSTGLIAARINPIYKPKPKKIELSGTTKPAPFVLRPFAGLFNPFPYGCSVLCNHPADGEAKEFVKRAKESWATEGKALLLPAEMEMIRANLIAGGIVDSSTINEQINNEITTIMTAVPEELFRKYTETDSRPLTPTPTLASGLGTNQRDYHDLDACNLREKTTLVLDLRTESQENDNETLSWHTLTLEPQPCQKKNLDNFKNFYNNCYQQKGTQPPPSSPVPQQALLNISDEGSSRNDDYDEDDSESAGELPMKRRGKKLKKRKYRRGSAYGQQNEVRDPLEPAETQVSQVDDSSRRNSTLLPIGNTEIKIESEKSVTPITENPYSSSFISPELLKHLARELDRETVENEFSLKRKIALEEALRIKGDVQSSKVSKQSGLIMQNGPRVYSRQSARFELLDSASLSSLNSLDYLGKYVFLPPGRKQIFGRTFNKYYDDTIDGNRYILPNDFMEALQEIMGGPLTSEQLLKFNKLIGNIDEPLNFRTWCGVCAACERLLSKLPSRDVDPPAWIERADFQALERRLKNVNADEKLILLLKEIRDC